MIKLTRFFTDAVRARMARMSGTSSTKAPGKERDAEWYDLSFTVFGHWKRHYTKSRYYFLWAVVADRLVTQRCQAVLDIGCGAGQFACLLRDRGVHEYHGLDFSRRRIEQARTICPEFGFHVEDAFATDRFSTLQYEAVVMTEVLEHVNDDLELIVRIPTGKRLLASVPNFASAGHVRFFDSIEEVIDRYSHVLSPIRVDALLGDDTGKVYYLIDGVVRANDA